MIFLKRNISIVLLAGVTFMPIFYSAYYYFAKMYVEHRMEEALENEQLYELTLPTNEIIWLKKEKEILVGSEMFDIKSFKIQGAYTIVKGLFDVQEKELKNKLLAFTAEEENKERKEVHLFNVIFSCFYPFSKNSFYDHFFLYKPHQYVVYNDTILPDSFLQNATPPPRRILTNQFS